MVEWLKGEFLCPLCQFHCNAVLPLLSVKREVRSSPSEEEEVSPPFSKWLQYLCEVVQSNLQETEKEEEISRVPGPACSTSSDEDQLTRIFPKYLKLQQKQGSAERCGAMCCESSVCVCVCNVCLASAVAVCNIRFLVSFYNKQRPSKSKHPTTEYYYVTQHLFYTVPMIIATTPANCSVFWCLIRCPPVF